MPKIRLVALMLTTMLGFAGPAVAANETVTIVADKWCPYNCGEKDAKPGYMVEIVRQAFKKSNIDVVYKVMPWSQAIQMTREGKYDAVVGASRGDVPDFVFPDVLQGISVDQFWVRKDSAWSYEGPDSLKDLRLGVIADYSYGKVMDAYLKEHKSDFGKTINVVGTDNATELNIDALTSGKVDAILEDKNVIQYYFASHDLPVPFKFAGNPVDMNNVDDTYIYVAFGPNNPKEKYYAKLLTRGVKEMRDNGELKAILTSYNVSEEYQFLGRAKDGK